MTAQEEKSEKISIYASRGKKKEVIPVSGSNAADLLDATNVRKRKISGNREKRKNISRSLLTPDIPEGQMLPPISEGSPQEQRNIEELPNVTPKVEVAENCELSFLSWQLK